MSTVKTSLTFITESLPGFKVGVSQHVSIQAQRWNAALWLYDHSKNLPANLTLSAGGTITGSVAQAAADRTVFVQVTDAARDRLTQAFDVQITP